MTHLRAALSILACRALEAHYRRNLARVVPQPEPMPQLVVPVPLPTDQRVITARVWSNADLAKRLGLEEQDFALWQAERERDVAGGRSYGRVIWPTDGTTP